MADVKDVYESARGCGYRKPGGYYLRTDGIDAFQCGKLPVELTVCPCCSGGIRPSRSFRWIKGQIIEAAPCVKEEEYCEKCSLSTIDPNEDIVLIWIGQQFYPTVKGFLEEGMMMGISRRLTGIPRGFKLGETRVALAHVHAINPISEDSEEPKAGIFYTFIPDRIEYTVKEEDTDEKLERIAEKGVHLVRTHRNASENYQNLIVKKLA